MPVRIARLWIDVGYLVRLHSPLQSDSGRLEGKIAPRAASSPMTPSD
jgi:hypothetical protein